MQFDWLTGDQHCGPFIDVHLKRLALEHHGVFHTQMLHDTDWLYRRPGARESEVGWFREYWNGRHDYSPYLGYHRFLGRCQAFPVRRVAEHLGISVVDMLAVVSPDREKAFSDLTTYDKLGVFGNRSIGGIGGGSPLQPLSESIAIWINEVLADIEKQCAITDQFTRLNELGSQFHQLLNSATQDGVTIAEGIARLSSVFRPTDFIPLKTSQYYRERTVAGLTFLLEFLRSQNLFTEAYNAALVEADPRYNRPLDQQNGELPFYPILRNHGLLIRGQSLYYHDGKLQWGDAQTSIADLTEESLATTLHNAGIEAVIGNGIAMAIEMRHSPVGRGIALLRGGAVYQSFVDQFSAELLVRGHHFPLLPVLYVDLDFFEAISTANLAFRLPDILAVEIGRSTLSGREVVPLIKNLISEGLNHWSELETPEPVWCRTEKHEIAQLKAELDRLSFALREKRPEHSHLQTSYSEAKRKYKTKLREVTDRQLVRYSRAWHLKNLSFFSSRGPLDIWSEVIGGPDFAKFVASRARITQANSSEHYYASLRTA